MAKRGQSIPIAPWWYEAARTKLTERAWTQAKLAVEVDDSEANVSRCLSGGTPTLHLIAAISRKLGIPRPVFLPQSELEALAIHGALGLRLQDEQLNDIAAAARTHEGNEPLTKNASSRRRRRAIGTSR